MACWPQQTTDRGCSGGLHDLRDCRISIGLFQQHGKRPKSLQPLGSRSQLGTLLLGAAEQCPWGYPVSGFVDEFVVANLRPPRNDMCGPGATQAYIGGRLIGSDVFAPTVRVDSPAPTLLFFLVSTVKNMALIAGSKWLMSG